MAASSVTPSSPPEDQIAALGEKVKNLAGGDNLTIKVYRRPGGANGLSGLGGVPHLIATFSGGVVAHMASPELWMPRLAGGGSYALEAYHADDSTKPLTGKLPFSCVGEPIAIDPTVTMQPGWAGPATMTYPQVQAPRAVAPAQPHQPSFTVGTPAPSFSTAPQTQSSGATTPGSPSSSASWNDPSYLINREREMAEEKARLQIENVRRQAEADRIALEAKMEARFAQLQSTSRPADGGGGFAEAIKAAVPIVMTWMDNQAKRDEARAEAQRRADERAEERAAEARRLADEATRRAEERHRDMMERMFAKPAIDPLTLQLLERRDANEQPLHMALMPILSGVQSMVSTQMDMARMVAESSGAPPESPMLVAFREMSSVIEKIAAASTTAAVPKVRPQRRVQPHAAEPTHSAPPQNVNAPAQSAPPPRASESVVDAQPSGFADYTAAPGVLTELTEMIRRREDVQKVADRLMEVMPTEEFQAALRDVEGSLPDLFRRQVGDAWSVNPDNLPYIQELLAKIQEVGQDHGIFSEPDADPDEQEEGNG